jgi:DNA-binding beta-propeller fold protein YncE
LPAVACLFLSCTVWTGPVKLATIGGDKGKNSSTPPPPTTGEISLEYVRSFGAEAGIRSPWGISFGVDGTLYVCDRDRSSVVRLDTDGAPLARYSGSGTRVERLYAPIDICSTAGMAVYAIDSADSRVLRFDRNLKNSYVMYRKDFSGNRLFGTLNGIAFDKISGDMYVTDRDTGSLIRIDMLGGSIASRGSFGSSKESFREPAGLDVSQEGVIYVADRGDGVVAVLENFGANIRHIGRDILEAPVDVAVIPETGIAVADRNGVVMLSPDGAALGSAGYGIDRSLAPRSVTLGEQGLYVSDGVTNTILIYRIVRKR